LTERPRSSKDAGKLVRLCAECYDLMKLRDEALDLPSRNDQRWLPNHLEQDELRERIAKLGGKLNGAHVCVCYDCYFLPAQVRAWMDTVKEEERKRGGAQ
jgi:hypothetical protein